MEEIDKPGEAMLPIIVTYGGRFVGDRRCGQIGPIRRDQRAAAVREHDQQHCDATATQGAHDLQNAALKGVPLADDSYRTREVAEMGSVWWRSSGAFRILTS